VLVVAHGCAEDPRPTDDVCEQAADHLVELFSTGEASEDPVARRAAQRHRRRFFEACRDGASLPQARCAIAAERVTELSDCR
jgi:hypothetical protein